MNNSEYYKIELNKSDYDTDNNDAANSLSQSQKAMSSVFTKVYRQVSRSLSTSADETTHNKNEVRSKPNTSKSVVIEQQGGLANKFVISLLLLWYLTSALTLYSNKFIMSSRKTDPTLIGTIQMIVTCCCCVLQMRYNQGNKRFESSHLLGQGFESNNQIRSAKFWANLLIICFLRLFSIVLGLMALKQASISFVETVKSSSPLFTVIVSKILIGEVTGFWTKISLLPIMVGLALSSSYELNFSAFGFIAAVLTNFTECIQNVFSKFLLCSDKNKFTPLQVQFFTSFGSVIALVPVCYFTVEFNEENFDLSGLFLYFFNGFSFNCQSILAFTLMSYISPVTYSVCNTVKRAVLIWFSVIIFQNNVSGMSAFGSVVVIIGVLSYNQAKIKDSNNLLNNIDNNLRVMHKI